MKTLQEAYILLGLIVCGLGIGLLTGLSVSPTLSTILTSLMTGTAMIVAILGGFSKENSFSIGLVNPWPLALLIVSILVGAVGGMQLRVHTTINFFEQNQMHTLLPPKNLDQIIKEWEAVANNDSVVAQKIFDVYFPELLVSGRASEKEYTKGLVTGLFDVSSIECSTLTMASSENLRQEMLGTSSDTIADFAKSTNDISKLRSYVELVCMEY